MGGVGVRVCVDVWVGRCSFFACTVCVYFVQYLDFSLQSLLKFP